MFGGIPRWFRPRRNGPFMLLWGKLKDFSSGRGETDVIFFYRNGGPSTRNYMWKCIYTCIYIYIYIYSTKRQSSEKVLTVSLSPFFEWYLMMNLKPWSQTMRLALCRPAWLAINPRRVLGCYASLHARPVIYGLPWATARTGVDIFSAWLRQ